MVASASICMTATGLLSMCLSQQIINVSSRMFCMLITSRKRRLLAQELKDDLLFIRGDVGPVIELFRFFEWTANGHYSYHFGVVYGESRLKTVWGFFASFEPLAILPIPYRDILLFMRVNRIEISARGFLWEEAADCKCLFRGPVPDY